MDIFVFLMPGSDGTARALREAMARGKPVIVADRGMLPELVNHGVSGLVVKDTSEGLAEAVLASLQRLLDMAQENNPDQQIQAVMEPTGMAWFPVAVFLIRHGVTVYLVNSQQVADLRKYFKKHAKSDRIDCRVLAKLPFVDAEKLHRLELSNAETLACQRGCKQLDRLMKQSTACRNRIIALDRFAWPGLEGTVFSDLFSPAALWFREHWYSPQRVWQAGVEVIRQDWLSSELDPKDGGEWIGYLVPLAEQIVAIYGEQAAYPDYELLQAEAIRE